MKVEIKLPLGDLSFNLTENQAVSLIQQAVNFAVGSTQIPTQIIRTEQTVKVEKIIPKSRVEAPTTPEPTEGDNELNPKYTGFLYIRCEECKKEKGYRAKIPTNLHRCECGHYTLLENLRPARTICKCGGDFHYKTNIKDRRFTMNCLNCDGPIDLELTGNWNAYGPMIEKDSED